MDKKIIAVRFKRTGKLMYFDPLHFGFRISDSIIASTERGEELGRVVKILNESEVPNGIEIKKIIKPATKKDMEIFNENKLKANEALNFCKDEIKKLKLNMKALAAEYTFDMSKLTIYFVSEERVDFRDLVKNIANKYKSRIELRQIGPRDEIKEYPNLGVCGKEVCCRTFLQDFEPVTIKNAKEQGLQINMSKLSGACGKLKCCLKYEEELYKENLSKLPKIGTNVKVKGESEEGKVTALDILKMNVKVKFGTNKEDERYEVYPVDMISFKENKINKEKEVK